MTPRLQRLTLATQYAHEMGMQVSVPAELVEVLDKLTATLRSAGRESVQLVASQSQTDPVEHRAVVPQPSVVMEERSDDVSPLPEGKSRNTTAAAIAVLQRHPGQSLSIRKVYEEAVADGWTTDSPRPSAAIGTALANLKNTQGVELVRRGTYRWTPPPIPGVRPFEPATPAEKYNLALAVAPDRASAEEPEGATAFAGPSAGSADTPSQEDTSDLVESEGPSMAE